MVFRAASGGLVRRSSKAATQTKLWLRVNDVQPVGRAAADSASTFAVRSPRAPASPDGNSRSGTLDTTSGPRPRLVTQPPRARFPQGGAAEFTHPALRIQPQPPPASTTSPPTTAAAIGERQFVAECRLVTPSLPGSIS
jgi:hypothetical protein